MGYKNCLSFNPRKMGRKAGWCLQNTRLGFGINSGTFATALQDKNNNAAHGTLHALSEYDYETAVPVYIDSVATAEHVGVLDHGVYYSDGRKATLPTSRVFGWGELCDGVRVVNYVKKEVAHNMLIYFKPVKESCVLRSAANKQSSKLAIIPVGVSATVTGFNVVFSNDGYEWVRVNYAGHQGFCQLDTKVYLLTSKDI